MDDSFLAQIIIFYVPVTLSNIKDNKIHQVMTNLIHFVYPFTLDQTTLSKRYFIIHSRTLNTS